MNENRMFDNMRAAAVQRLEGRNPGDIAAKAGIGFDGGQFRLNSLGQAIRISWPELAFTPELPGWHALVILHYLDIADGTPVQNAPVPFSKMRDGMVRGGGFDKRCESALETLMSVISEDALSRRCVELGGRIVDTNADFTAILPFLPNWPVTLKVWFADDEFGASGRMLADLSADHYLTIEDAVTVGEIILERLSGGEAL